MKRSSHYERAIEAYLQWHGLGYIAVDETRRAILGDTPIKSLDFIVCSIKGARLTVDVKGRQFPTGKPGRRRHVWECWAAPEDIEGLLQWSALLGSDYRGILLFTYHVLPEVDLPDDTEDLWLWQGRRYLLRGVLATDYQQHMRVRSPSWGTVTLPRAIFRSVVRPLHHYLTPPVPAPSFTEECPF